MTPQKTGAGVGAPTPKIQATNSVLRLYRAVTLMETTRALVAVDEAGFLPELREEIWAAHRQWRQDQFAETIGERLLIDELAGILDWPEIEPVDAKAAIRNAIRPLWPTVLCETIIAFAARLKAGAV